MPVRNVSRCLQMVILGGVMFLPACGPSRQSQENMARNIEQAQDPNLQPAQQDLLPPAANDPPLDR